MNEKIHDRIRVCLKALAGGDLPNAATHLLGELGYRSDRIMPGQTGQPSDFVLKWPAPVLETGSERDLLEEARSISILFQFADTEIDTSLESTSHFAANCDFLDGESRSFFFAAVDLDGGSYSRHQYTAFTRELNKRVQVPTVVLYRTTTSRITLAFVYRRQSLVDPDRDVLGKVALVREIDSLQPHRAHIDVLANLTLSQRLEWIDVHRRHRNFDGLLEAWLDSLDTEALSRRFYRDLFAWFQRAVGESSIPTAVPTDPSAEQHIIRLITRLLFCWFIKEKGLIANDLFVEDRIKELLKGYNRSTGDSYYRAVLQNLFFATLNKKVGTREFNKPHSRDHSSDLYHHAAEITDVEGLCSLFAKTPFINGGLFDCLDGIESSDTRTGDMDYFFDTPEDRKGYSIPNHLFFGECGIIELFKHYKFTVEENTPAEQEVALDPELLGKVFENLLASLNPATRNTARQETGSYYTPRFIVDYMVDEMLVDVLVQRISPEPGNGICWEHRLRILLDYDSTDIESLFTTTENHNIVRVVSELKILDPAVGSGAFPMGLLNKLTLVLRRLDPDNLVWKQIQREHIQQRSERTSSPSSALHDDADLAELSAVFETAGNSDYGRKLYIIQNSLYGVDIQPIATQVAKLRFFISLAIEQDPSGDVRANYGMNPLPNLETHLVAADTLVGLQRPSQQNLGQSEVVERLEGEIAANRKRYFLASTPSKKQMCREEDMRLRTRLAHELEEAGFHVASAKQVAAWRPFDQNASASWFDSQFMFNVSDGFDIVIGNPPYVESRNSLLTDAMKDLYGKQVQLDWRGHLPRGSDLLVYFLARVPKLMNDSGTASLITQNAWMSTDYGRKFQRFTLGKFSFKRIVDTSGKFFTDTSSQNINAVIAMLKRVPQEFIEYHVVDEHMVPTVSKLIPADSDMKWGHYAAMPTFFAKILNHLHGMVDQQQTISFGQGLNVPKAELRQSGNIGVVTDAAFVAARPDVFVDDAFVSDSRRGRIPALIMPRGIGDRYYCAFNNSRSFSYSGVEAYIEQSMWFTDFHYCLWAYLNSSLVWLYREITGRKNLGGGMLKAEATDMKALPVQFDFTFADEARTVYSTLQSRRPYSVEAELATDEHMFIDQMVTSYFGIANWDEDIRNALLELTRFRCGRAHR